MNMLIDKGKVHEAGPTNANGGWTDIHKDFTAATVVLPSMSLSQVCMPVQGCTHNPFIG